MVLAKVDEALLKELQDMGFGEARSVRAIYHSGATDLTTAANWLVEHEGDADIDEPLLVSKDKERGVIKLSPEEGRKKAEDLMRKAKERRDKEEKVSDVLREKERIRSGKELQKVKAAEEESSLRRNVEARAREKAADAAYREKLRLKMEEDKKERRRKLGLPEELTDEEKARDAERAEKARLEAEAKKVFTFIKPVSVIEKLRSSLVTMKKSHASEQERFKCACSTLLKYIANVVNNPEEDKYRSIKLSNAAFQQRVGSLTGSLEFLEHAGFQPGEDVLCMPRDKLNLEVLNAAGLALNDALTNPFFGLL
ncbi:MAG: hypothetical protein WDW38_004097 [Sanguina aurantia]